jgi:hypothetical protein
MFGPYGLIAGGVLWAASVVAAALWGMDVGDDRAVARQLRETTIEQRASAAAADAAASAIAAIEIRHVTVRQQLEREVQTREVFRECRSGDAARQLLNTGAAPSASAPADYRIVPGAPAAAR